MAGAQHVLDDPLTVVGWISDGAGGLQRGLVFSAFALLVGALLASWQRVLQHHA